MRTSGKAGRGGPCSESVPVPHRTYGQHFPKPPPKVSTSPFPELSPEEARAPLVPSQAYAASLQPKKSTSPQPRTRLDEAKAHALLSEASMSRKRMATELGISPETLRRFAREHGYPSGQRQKNKTTKKGPS